jgi:hypothetical protein
MYWEIVINRNELYNFSKNKTSMVRNDEQVNLINKSTGNEYI